MLALRVSSAPKVAEAISSASFRKRSSCQDFLWENQYLTVRFVTDRKDPFRRLVERPPESADPPFFQ